MKKQNIWILLGVEISLLALMVGFFFGRNSSASPIQTSKLPDPTTASISQTEATEFIGKVNINTADVQQLQTLPGIGPVLAQRIVDYREEHGPFGSISELTQVSGIGLERLDKIMEYVTVGGSQ